MTLRQPDPLRLDVAAFAAAGGELDGTWHIRDLPRLAELQTAPHDMAPEDVQWSVAGQTRPVAGAAPQTWLTLQARAKVWLTCQRCLQPFQESLVVKRELQFVRGEAQAEALDAESEHDVLALSTALDLRELIEDELLLALPIIARHEVCPQPLPAMVSDDAAAASLQDAPANPFAALARLKRDTQ